MWARTHGKKLTMALRDLTMVGRTPKGRHRIHLFAVHYLVTGTGMARPPVARLLVARFTTRRRCNFQRASSANIFSLTCVAAGFEPLILRTTLRKVLPQAWRSPSI